MKNKNKKIILAGGGNEEDSKLLDKFFISLIEKGKKLVYVPVAMDSRPYLECFNWFKKVMENLNFNNFEMIENLGEFELSEDIGAIYLGGGNTFKLLKEIKETKFDEKLRKFIKLGGVLYGGSAGAIVLGKDIKTSSDNNYSINSDFSGLNLISSFSIWCHYHGEDESIINYISSTGNKVLAISERSGVFISGDKIKVIGEPIVLFKENKKQFIKKGKKLIFLKT